MPVGERRGRVGSVGIKTGGKKERDGERELCATINHLLGVQVYLASFFFFFEIQSTQERERGAGGWGGKRGRRSMWRGGGYLGVRIERSGGQRSLETKTLETDPPS